MLGQECVRQGQMRKGQSGRSCHAADPTDWKDLVCQFFEAVSRRPRLASKAVLTKRMSSAIYCSTATARRTGQVGGPSSLIQVPQNPLTCS